MGEGSDVVEMCPPIEKIMIWSERDALKYQVSQIGVSACGPTAVLNVLIALGYPCTKDDVVREIYTRTRKESSPVSEYLLSRSVAGTTHEDLIDGMTRITNGAIIGRFFHFFPQRNVNVTTWLGHWIKNGAVPVCTLNLQRSTQHGQVIPDAWHHQMVFGVGQGVYLTNPVDCIPQSVLEDQLCSDSVLLVRAADIATRWRDGCDLSPLVMQSDNRWNDMNVLGQVMNILRQCITSCSYQFKTHALIPAAYKAGITIFARRNTPICEELVAVPELPILYRTEYTLPQDNRHLANKDSYPLCSP